MNRPLIALIAFIAASVVGSFAHAQCSNAVTDADIANTKAAMIAEAKRLYGYDIRPSDAEVRQEAQYRVEKTHITCLTNSAIKRDEEIGRRAEQENDAYGAAADALSDTANGLKNMPTQSYMPPASAFELPSPPSMPPIDTTPMPDPCSMMSCSHGQASSPQYIPYDAVKGFMPGMNPDGTVR